MGDSMTTIIVIFLGVILIFVFPLLILSGNNDNTAQMGVQTKVSEYVSELSTTGKLTPEKIAAFQQELTALGSNAYQVDYEIKVLDENPGKKTVLTTKTKIGENIYYSVYTSQIDEFFNDPNNKVYVLKEGDIVTVSVKNTNQTIFDILTNFVSSTTSENSGKITGTASMVVMANGSN